MNSSYGAWGTYGAPSFTAQTNFTPNVQTAPKLNFKSLATYAPPQAQVTVAAPATKGPSLEEILAGLGSLLAPKQVTEQQVAEVQTAAADGYAKKPWLLIGLGVGGVVILGVGAYFLLRAKRRR